MTFGDREAGILDDHDRAVPKWAGILAGIMEELTRLEAGLADMKLECLRLEAAGMWPAVPTESWEGRGNSTHGEKRYLRLVFPRHTRGLDRRKVYVGADPARVRTARRKAANRRQWEILERAITRLERTLRGIQARLESTGRELRLYELPDLGTESPPADVAAVPRESWHDDRGGSPEDGD